uniref:Uncharacterized protein n=1 Tax=Vespula pensylvanica TaxID=30213 RepID=A0A834P9U0_VESPE|nr:hypothetical protein H0235_002293 [Vespula pensylvanica]
MTVGVVPAAGGNGTVGSALMANVGCQMIGGENGIIEEVSSPLPDEELRCCDSTTGGNGSTTNSSTGSNNNNSSSSSNNNNNTTNNTVIMDDNNNNNHRYQQYYRHHPLLHRSFTQQQDLRCCHQRRNIDVTKPMKDEKMIEDYSHLEENDSQEYSLLSNSRELEETSSWDIADLRYLHRQHHLHYSYCHQLEHQHQRHYRNRHHCQHHHRPHHRHHYHRHQEYHLQHQEQQQPNPHQHACSSRSTPKPRPPTPTPRPNITFHMYTCPPDYAEWYCLNGATCFTVKIVDSLLYNCFSNNNDSNSSSSSSSSSNSSNNNSSSNRDDVLMAISDRDASSKTWMVPIYVTSRQRVMLETASIAGGATIAVFLVVIICIAAYIHFIVVVVVVVVVNSSSSSSSSSKYSNCFDTVDGPGRDPELRPFSNRSRSLMIYMAKNPPNSSATIEQTRMPGWNRVETMESMRMASISESKRSSQ